CPFADVGLSGDTLPSPGRVRMPDAQWPGAGAPGHCVDRRRAVVQPVKRGAMMMIGVTVMGAVGPVPVTTLFAFASTLLLNVPAVVPTVTEKVKVRSAPAPTLNAPDQARSCPLTPEFAVDATPLLLGPSLTAWEG